MKPAALFSAPHPLLHHALPFVAWILAMELLPAGAGSYAVRSALGLGLLLLCRPWRYFPNLRPTQLPLAIAAGLGVFILWILPELPLMLRHWPQLAEYYARWGILPPWAVTGPLAASPYAPEAAGWSLALIRLLGSALIIAPIEEFFWRGFLYRWLVDRNFLQVSLLRWAAGPFWITVALFGLEHDRWLVGMIAGAVYGLLVIRTGNLGTAIWAHVTTNLALGIYVLASGDYRFW